MAEDAVDVTSATWESEVLKADGLVMVLFWAQWCKVSTKVFSTVEEMAQECAEKVAEEVKVVRINIEDNDEVASSYKISIIPTIMLFRDGRKLHHTIGAKPEKQFKEWPLMCS
jgi:thioredoxin 1